ncbi:GRAM domain-containing protein 2B isoform X2 [Tachysurus fulvidraco]|uniref:GRAM domain-containing protein 2B isoform X2 n=1 Tax=Tachysurus fulvidraco TaxID=1234273 RepID=UPI001FEFC06F|nr:GRAM domain-containing protein 2B isoform X2 [Tachysurus fulvidraco]
MEKPFGCDDAVLRSSSNTDRPTCPVLPSQLNEHVLQCHNTENGREENSRRIMKSNMSLSMDSPSEILERRGKPTLIRSKTFDPSLLSHVQCDIESKTERKKQHSCHFHRTNAQYHKLFKDISENELLKQSYTCALQKDILYQGRLFVSDNWICFYSKVFGKDTKIAIPVISVSVIKKTKTAILVPNALIIATALERDKCLGNNPVPHSSADGNYTVSPSTLPMNYAADLSDLDGPVDQRRQEIGYSSSSDSPESPLYKKIAEHKRNVFDSKTQRPSLFNVLLMVYLFLICILIMSSCYMAYKIIYLEKRLNSIGSMAELTHSRDEYNCIFSEDTSSIYSAVSINLVKLEKIQRGLKKLLDETK